MVGVVDLIALIDLVDLAHQVDFVNFVDLADVVDLIGIPTVNLTFLISATMQQVAYNDCNTKTSNQQFMWVTWLTRLTEVDSFHFVGLVNDLVGYLGSFRQTS